MPSHAIGRSQQPGGGGGGIAIRSEAETSWVNTIVKFHSQATLSVQFKCILVYRNRKYVAS